MLAVSAGAVLALLPSDLPADPPTRPPAQVDTLLLDRAAARIDAALRARMRDDHVPGAAVVLVSRSGLRRVQARGVSDVAGATPVTANTLFAVGSISKTVTALALLTMREEEMIGLDRPVTTYLPWFRPPSSFEPFTVHQLLTHTAGLVRDRDDIPSSPYAAAALAERAPGARPGARFAYSNLGYQFLSLLMEEVGGWPHVAATPADLGALLAVLLARGVPVVDARSFEMLFARAVRAPSLGAATRYGYGLIVDSLDGREVWWNSGATQGFRAFMILDPAAGVAVGVLMNGPGNVRRVGEFSLRTFRAALEQAPLPPVPSLVAPAFVSDAADYAGEYGDELGEAIRLEAEGNTLLIVAPEGRVVLERMGSDRFHANMPRFALFPLQFGRDSSGAVTEVAYGGEWFVNQRARGPRRFEFPREWVRYLGHYRAAIPWSNNFRVILRKGVLLYVTPEGSEEVLVPDRVPGQFRVGADPESPERLQFDTVVSGRALRAVLSGVSYYRSFAP